MEKNKNTESKKKAEKTSGQQMQKTNKTRTLEGSNNEILIGKNLEEVNKVKEGFNSLEKKILNKLM
jgi:hypothetical protein